MVKECFKSAVLYLAILQLIFVFSQEACAQNNKRIIKESDFCSLFDTSLKDYEGEIVKTRAYMIYSTFSRVDGGDSFFYSPKCNNEDFFAVEKFLYKKDPWKKWNGFFSKLAAEKTYIFEVKLTGKVSVSIFPSFGHLGWSRNEFEAVKIESIKDVTSNIANPDTEAEAPLRNQGESLKNINLEVMSYFWSSRIDANIHGYLGDEFILIDTFGNNYNKQNYRELKSKGLFGNMEIYETAVQTRDVKQLQNSYKVLGSITASDKGGKKQTLYTENTFQYENDSWILTESKFSKS